MYLSYVIWGALPVLFLVLFAATLFREWRDDRRDGSATDPPVSGRCRTSTGHARNLDLRVLRQG
jgi:hypothetical protein